MGVKSNEINQKSQEINQQGKATSKGMHMFKPQASSFLLLLLLGGFGVNGQPVALDLFEGFLRLLLPLLDTRLECSGGTQTPAGEVAGLPLVETLSPTANTSHNG